jgi:signal transduction histidine kinase
VLREPESVVVEVTDQGKGISPERLAEIQTRGSGVGIRGMRERLRQFNGELTIDSNGAGTTVRVTIPVPKPAVEFVSDVQQDSAVRSAGYMA